MDLATLLNTKIFLFTVWLIIAQLSSLFTHRLKLRLVKNKSFTLYMVYISLVSTKFFQQVHCFLNDAECGRLLLKMALSGGWLATNTANANCVDCQFMIFNIHKKQGDIWTCWRQHIGKHKVPGWWRDEHWSLFLKAKLGRIPQIRDLLSATNTMPDPRKWDLTCPSPTASPPHSRWSTNRISLCRAEETEKKTLKSWFHQEFVFYRYMTAIRFLASAKS